MLKQRSAAELVAPVVLVANGSSCRRRRAADAYIPVHLRIAATDAPSQQISIADPCAVVSPQLGRPIAAVGQSVAMLRLQHADRPIASPWLDQADLLIRIDLRGIP